jgi:trehalose 6-phosphate synthase/phosphatase
MGRESKDPRRSSLSVNSGRIIIASNHLPLRVKKGEGGYEFEWDEDALVAQAKDGIPRQQFQEVMYVGSLPVDIEVEEQEVRKGRRKDEIRGALKQAG